MTTTRYGHLINHKSDMVTFLALLGTDLIHKQKSNPSLCGPNNRDSVIISEDRCNENSREVTRGVWDEEEEGWTGFAHFWPEITRWRLSQSVSYVVV